jgi:hypothetical protein
VRRRSGRPDRRIQLLRAGGGGGDLACSINSGAALATVVGVLIEVPVMLSVVGIVKRTRGWYEGGTTTQRPPDSSQYAERMRRKALKYMV